MSSIRVRCLLVVGAIGVVASASAAPFDKSGIADWTKPPAATAERAFTPPVAKRLRLANGLAVLVVENHTLPIAAMDLIVPGAGAAADPRQRAGLAAFTADMVDEGAGGMSALAIADEATRLGAELQIHADADAVWLSTNALTRTLDPVLDLVAKVVTQPAFTAADFERVKGDRLTTLTQRRDRPREVASVVLSQAVYGPGTAYGHPAGGTLEDVKRIALADVQAFYRAHWNPAAMTLVIVGDVDPAAVQRKLDGALGRWRPTGGVAPALPSARPAKLATRLLLVDRPGAEQSDVRIGRVGLDRRDQRYSAFEVMRTVLGDGFTSRLNHRLREELGITYGIGAAMSWHVAPGLFSIPSAIVAAETSRGVAEIIKILDELAAVDVPAAELDKAKQNLVRALPAMFETNAQTAGVFAELALYKLPDDWYASFADGVRKVTAGDVRQVARALVASSTMAFAIVGDLAKIGPSLDKLGLGAPARYDLDGARLLAPPPRR